MRAEHHIGLPRVRVCLSLLRCHGRKILDAGLTANIPIPQILPPACLCRFYYAKGMNADEAYVFVCYDSRASRARFTPHTGACPESFHRVLAICPQAPSQHVCAVRGSCHQGWRHAAQAQDIVILTCHMPCSHTARYEEGVRPCNQPSSAG